MHRFVTDCHVAAHRIARFSSHRRMHACMHAYMPGDSGGGRRAVPPVLLDALHRWPRPEHTVQYQVTVIVVVAVTVAEQQYRRAYARVCLQGVRASVSRLMCVRVVV